MASNLGRHELSTIPRKQYGFDAPFALGDKVCITEDGFSIKPGHPYTVSRCDWVSHLNEWCIFLKEIHGRGDRYGYRARRFEKVGAVEKEHEMLNNIWTVIEVTADGDIANLASYCPVVVRGNRSDMEQYVSGLLKLYPERRYIFGRLNLHAKVEAPPVKISNL